MIGNKIFLRKFLNFFLDTANTTKPSKKEGPTCDGSSFYPSKDKTKK